MPRHTSKAHAKYETETKIVLVAADLTFYGITQLPLFSFVNPFLYRLLPSKRRHETYWTCPIMSVHTVSKIVLSYRAAKADARTAIGAHAAEMETKPFRQNSNPNRKPFFQSFLDSCRSLIKQRFSLLTMLRWTRLLENSSHVTATTITACLMGKKQSSPATVLHHAYKYSVSKLHSPYGKLSTRQIQER